MIRLLYFGAVREAVGIGSEERDIPASVSTPRALANWLSAQGGAHAAAFADQDRLRCAVDQEMRPLDAPLGDAREIAFFPPVTGG